MTELTEIVQRLINEGRTPQELLQEFDDAIIATGAWHLRWHGQWAEKLVCSKCGSAYPDLCNDGDSGTILYPNDPKFHKNQPGVKTMSFTEWQQGR